MIFSISPLTLWELGVGGGGGGKYEIKRMSWIYVSKKVEDVVENKRENGRAMGNFGDQLKGSRFIMSDNQRIEMDILSLNIQGKGIIYK